MGVGQALRWLGRLAGGRSDPGAASVHWCNRHFLVQPLAGIGEVGRDIAIDPLEVVDHDAPPQALGNAVQRAIERSHGRAALPKDWTAARDSLVAAADVTSDAAFARGTRYLRVDADKDLATLRPKASLAMGDDFVDLPDRERRCARADAELLGLEIICALALAAPVESKAEGSFEIADSTLDRGFERMVIAITRDAQRPDDESQVRMVYRDRARMMSHVHGHFGHGVITVEGVAEYVHGVCPSSPRYFLDADRVSDNDIGVAVAAAFADSRALFLQHMITPVEATRAQVDTYEVWLGLMMARHEKSSTKAFLAPLRFVNATRDRERIQIQPTNHESLHGWGGDGIAPEAVVTLDRNPDHTELGAALRLAFSRCLP